MKEFLEQFLHRQVCLETYPTDQLPLVWQNTIRLFMLQIDGQACLLIMPNEKTALQELRRYYHQVMRITGMLCALYLRDLTYYAMDILLQEGIPFVWENRQMYLPFIGIMLDRRSERPLKIGEKISFITQKMLLKALYEAWQGITVSQAAEKMQVSRMTVTRCFDEIEVWGLPLLKVRSRARKLYTDPDKHVTWEAIHPVLRCPIIRTFRLAEEISSELPMSGLSALAAYSMLEDELFPTVAFEKKQIKDLDTDHWKQVPPGEQPVCVAHEVGYILPFDKKHAVDPLSVTLMLTDKEKDDPRIAIAINEMLEEYVW